MRLDCDTVPKKLVENDGEREAARKKDLKMAAKIKSLEIKLKAEINPKELMAKGLQVTEKRSPCDELLSLYDLLWVSPTASIEKTQPLFKGLAL